MKLTFDANLYCANKAQQLNATNFALAGYPFPWTAEGFGSLLQNIRMTPQKHFEWYGANEGINPFIEIDGFLMLTDTTSDILKNINQQINDQVRGVYDSTLYGQPDWWALPLHNQGDCEDHAIAKDKELAKQGIQGSLACLTIPGGVYHAVLIVHTNEGDLVLDNMTDKVKNVADTSYAWDIMEDRGEWYKVEVENNRLVKKYKRTAPTGYKQWLTRRDYNKNTW